jgi:cell division protein YceG involved in septum cleavage
VVQSGDSSYKVCKKLAEAGLIADAGAFDTYLYNGGYDRKLRTGTYEIPVGAEQEEIAAILTHG